MTRYAVYLVADRRNANYVRRQEILVGLVDAPTAADAILQARTRWSHLAAHPISKLEARKLVRGDAA